MTFTIADDQTNTACLTAGEDDMLQYLQDIRQFPLLTEEEELALARSCARGDENAIRKMVHSNLRLVVRVAREYAGRGVPLLDLIQEGSIGLLTAAGKFDPELGFRFSTYATKWIRRGVLRCLAEDGNLIRVPSHTAEKIRKVIQTRTVLQQELGRMPNAHEIGDRCDMESNRVEQLLQLEPQVSSLDAPAGEDSSLSMLLEDVQVPHPQDQLIRDALAQTMNDLLSTLTDRQRLVLRLHFGMEDGVCHSLEQISSHLGVSKERVRQIKQQAMTRLKKNGAGYGLEDFLNE